MREGEENVKPSPCDGPKIPGWPGTPERMLTGLSVTARWLLSHIPNDPLATALLSLPPAGNHGMIPSRGKRRIILSKDMREWKERAQRELTMQRHTPTTKPVFLVVIVYQDRERDSDSAYKQIKDALTGHCYMDDKQVRHDHIFAVPPPNPFPHVRVLVFEDI